MVKASGLADYCGRIWKTRFFLLCLVKQDLQARYRRSTLGIAWSMLHPLAMTTVLCVISHQMLKLSLREHIPFVLSGMAIWTFLSQSMVDGCNSILQGEKYIRSHPMPIAIYPLRSTLSVSIHFCIILSLAIVITGLVKGYANPFALLSLLIVIPLLLLFGWAVGILFGFTTIYFPDTSHLTAIGLQVLFYCTPVFYPADRIEMGILRNIIRYNPLGIFVELCRDPIVYGSFPPLMTFTLAVTTVSILSTLAVLTLATQERQLIYYM